MAIAEADVILFVVDATPASRPPISRPPSSCARANAPLLVVVNKADNEKRELEAAEFYSLGWDETYPISAIHGRGVADLLDVLVWALPPESPAELARKAREQEADVWSREELAAGRLEPFVVGRRPTRRGRGRRSGCGDREAPDLDGVDAEAIPTRSAGMPDRSRRRGDAGRHRDRRPPERRQVEPRERAPRRGADDRQRHPGHHARRHRHGAGVGPQLGRADRHGRGQAARQGRFGSGGRDATRPCARSRRSSGPTWRSSSSTRSRA